MLHRITRNKFCNCKYSDCQQILCLSAVSIITEY